MTNLIDALGASAVMQLRATQSPTPAARALYRARVKKQITSCTNCQLHAHQPDDQLPVPFASPKQPVFVVVGEAPGPEESERGKPFIGPSGKLLRALMRDVEIDPEDDVLWTNTVSCFPNVDGQIRRPKVSETEFCRANMFDQIEAGYTKYVLLVGARAFDAWRSDLNVTNHHGRLFVWLEQYAVMGIPHPSAVLRGQRALKRVIREDLERWRDICYGDDDPLHFLETACIRCGQVDVEHWDRDGVPYCARHWEVWKGEWEKQRRRYDIKVEQLSVF